MIHIDITKFCDAHDDRAYCTKPYLLDGDTYATDGNIIVRVTGIHAAALDVEFVKSITATAKKFTDPTLFVDGFIPFPPLDLPAPLPCEDCEGKGTVNKPQMVDCDDCDGNGDFYHRSHRYDCENCGGEGSIEGEGDGVEITCKDCHGTCLSDKIVLVAIGDRHFQAKYLRNIADLPNVKYKLDDGVYEMMRFTFDGGVGVLMPCRV